MSDYSWCKSMALWILLIRLITRKPDLVPWWIHATNSISSPKKHHNTCHKMEFISSADAPLNLCCTRQGSLVWGLPAAASLLTRGESLLPSKPAILVGIVIWLSSVLCLHKLNSWLVSFPELCAIQFLSSCLLVSCILMFLTLAKCQDF